MFKVMVLVYDQIIVQLKGKINTYLAIKVKSRIHILHDYYPEYQEMLNTGFSF
jgi:hypothetical protein